MTNNAFKNEKKLITLSYVNLNNFYKKKEDFSSIEIENFISENEEKLKKTEEWIKEMESLKIPCGPIFNIKQAVENPQIKERNMIIKSYHKKIGEFKSAGNPIKMSTYDDKETRGDIPDLDEHREKIIKEFS